MIARRTRDVARDIYALTAKRKRERMNELLLELAASLSDDEEPQEDEATGHIWPGKGHPWGDFLYYRMRLLDEWRREGKTAEGCAKDLAMDPGQVRLLWMTWADHYNKLGSVER